MADIGIKASLPGIDATTTEPFETSFNSTNYMHAIAKTEYRGADADVAHTVGYLPVCFIYAEDVNNAGEWTWAGATATASDGITKELVHLDSSANRHRFYVMFQPI